MQEQGNLCLLLSFLGVGFFFREWLWAEFACHFWACETKRSVCFVRVVAKKAESPRKSLCGFLTAQFVCVNLCVCCRRWCERGYKVCVRVCETERCVYVSSFWMCETGRRVSQSIVCSCLTASLWCVRVCVFAVVGVECVKMGEKCVSLFFCVCVSVWQRMTDGPAGRSRGRWMRWQTETDSPLSLRHNPSFSLPLFSFSACRDDAVPLVLSQRRRGKGGRWGDVEKRKKLHSSGISVYSNPPSSFSSLHSFPSFSPSSSVSIPSFLASPPPPSPSSSCQSESVVSIAPFGLIQLCGHHSYHIKRIPPTPIRTFIPNLRTSTSARVHLFVVRIPPGKFFIIKCWHLRFHMCSYLMLLECGCVCVCLCVWPVGKWSINHADGVVCCLVGSWCSGRFQGPGTGLRQGFPEDTHTHPQKTYQFKMPGWAHAVHTE